MMMSPGESSAARAVTVDSVGSPDGTMILFCRAPAPEGPWQICLKKLDADEEEFIQLTKDGSNSLPDWHPTED